MQHDYKTILVTALIASGLFLLVYGMGLGFLFMFIPTLPLFAAGLAKHPNLALYSGIAACLPLMVLISPPASASLFFLGIFVLPCWYLTHMALKSRDLKLENNAVFRIWFPVGIIIIHLAVYACAVLALVTGFYATQDTTLPQLLTTSINEQVTQLQTLYKVELNVSVPQLSFMLCGFMAWMWGVALWLHAWLANRALHKRSLAKRANLSVTPFPMPGWLLTLIGICALASLIGGESMAFLGKSCLIILLLPYCFQGAAYVHTASRAMPNRKIFLGIMYFFILAQFWPALILAGIGLWQHLKFLNKHLQMGGTSSK